QAAPDRVPHTSQHTQTSHSERSEESLSADATPSFEPSPATRGPRSTADNATQSGPKHLIGNSAPGLASQRGAVAAPATNSADGRPLIGIAPGAAWGPSKRWPAERYAAVADRLHDEYDACCILLTGPGEEETRAAVQKAARHPLLEIDSGKPTIATLKAAVSLLDVLVCNDSGPRHVAIAFNVPTVCIMGPTRPIYSTGPYERGALLRVDVDCGPCQRPTCRTDHRCMTRITPETVAEKASHIWLVEPSD
ncbi:MAG: glycosyltransferase family 9 protein, partial [Candidatus Hydrogenedentales bacterium]